MQNVEVASFRDGLNLNLPRDGQVKSKLNSVEKQCNVCALGACMLSHIRLNNAVTYEELDGMRGYDIRGHLSDYFDEDQLDLIENCFENIYFSNSANLNGQFNKYQNPSQRLRAIMLNIVRNKGSLLAD